MIEVKMSELFANNPGDIELIRGNKHYPAKFWDNSIGLDQEVIPVYGSGQRGSSALVTGWRERIGCVEMTTDWLTKEQMTELTRLTRPTMAFEVIAVDDGQIVERDKCSLLRAEMADNNTIKYFYMTLAI